jgi:hypothetical protein
MVSRVLSLSELQCIDTWSPSARFGSNQTLSSLSFTIVGSSLVAWCYQKNPMRTHNLYKQKPMYTIIDTQEGLEMYNLLRLKSALKLEVAGMKHSSGKSVYAHVKRRFGFKGSKESVLQQLINYINTTYGVDFVK